MITTCAPHTHWRAALGFPCLSAAGPPFCCALFPRVWLTCGRAFSCVRYGSWRSNSKDDYVGEGLERRQAAILSPKGISKEDLEKRAADFAAGNM